MGYPPPAFGNTQQLNNRRVEGALTCAASGDLNESMAGAGLRNMCHAPLRWCSRVAHKLRQPQNGPAATSQSFPLAACWLQVQYTALPHYEDKFEDFKADTVVLRRRFTPEGECLLRHVNRTCGVLLAAVAVLQCGVVLFVGYAVLC